jgi:hypothetical protein
VPGLLGNKLPAFKVGRCKGCADCDAGKVDKRGHKLGEKRAVTKEMLDELDEYFRPLIINRRDLKVIAKWVQEGKVALPL